MIRLTPPRLEAKALVEGGLMLAAVVAMGRTLAPADPWLLGFNPHPFWAVLIIAAVRHGLSTAPLIAIACGVLHLVALRQAPANAGGALSFMPLWYLVVAVLISEALAQVRRRADHFRAEATRAGERAAAAEARAASLEQAYRQVEGRLAGRTDTAIALYDGARHLASLDRGEILHGVLRLLTGHLGVERASIWVASELGGFTRLDGEGGTGMAMPLLGEAVLAEGMVVGAHERWGDGEAPAEAGLLAGPLRADSARIEAVVVIESMRFAAFTPSLIREFELLLDWSSRALGNAVRSALASSTGRRTTARLRPLDRDEAQDQEQADQPAMLLAATLEGDDMDEAMRRRLETVVRRICRHLTRPNDPVTWKPLDGTVVMFLPGAHANAGERLRERIDQSLESFGFRPWQDQRGPVLRWAQVAASGQADAQIMYRDALDQLRSR